MISFFRKIRQRLLTDNKVSKYLLYAIGEIILVVAGILIALQVNNWNEQRKSENEAKRILSELHSEFNDNRKVLSQRIKDLEIANENVRLILAAVNERELNGTQNIDSIISRSLKYGNYNPANSTILELINSGILNLISDGILKQKIYQWIQLLEDTDEDFKNQDQQATTTLIPYLTRNISIKNLNYYNNMGVTEESKLFDKKYSNIFTDLEFENLYQSKLFWNTIMLQHYRELDSLAVEILIITD
ncbi:MAG: hypothetical protein KJP01_07135 [Gramella sp.]|nr:hypothetical protein [Christiangramia sp.]